MTQPATHSGSSPSLPPASRPYAMRWIVILALLTALGPLSIDMYLPALPVMATDLAVDTAVVANSLPAYFFGLALGQLIYGPISDRIGRKLPLYFGLSLFVVASLACTFAGDIAVLFVARFFQALGGCVGVVMARAAIRDTLSVADSAQAYSMLMLVMGVAPILAPMLGSALLLWTGWQGIFALLVAVGVICLLLVHFYFKESLAPQARRHLTVSQVFSTYWDLLKDHRFRTPALAGGLLGAAMFTYISAASELFIDHFGVSAQHFAWIFGLNALGLIILSQLNGRLVKRVGLLRLLHVGASIQSFGALFLLALALSGHSTLWTTMFGLFCVVSGVGFTGPNATAIALAAQGQRAGMASALVGALQFGFGLLAGLALYVLPMDLTLAMSTVIIVLIGVGLTAVYVLRWREHKVLPPLPPTGA
ncbi:multidrug effflux MFS transporter [Alkanindiges sp. WGS2144]|uniref:multidrug effflux MFS transporter n=1 Tax=Alkanindiges sp. WGS2144 TaxID=3366808 RepID=UPI0037521290